MAKTERSSLREVRNPILGLPAAKAIFAMPVDTRMALARLLEDLALDCRKRADECWRKHKAPMAAYWKACSVYAGHIRKVLLQ